MKRAADLQEGVSVDLRWDLVQRVVSSSVFSRSKRLRQFLLFVCEQAIREPEREVLEQEISAAVFGKSKDFDPTQDTIVRVHASHLRKRLQEYFSAEGLDEDMIIEIPKGSYGPIFLERKVKQAAQLENLFAERIRWSGRRVITILAAAIIVLIAYSGWLSVKNRQISQRLNRVIGVRPAVDAFWQQMFGNGLHTYVILPDGNFTIFQDLIHAQLSPTEYKHQQFDSIADSRIADPTHREFAKMIMRHKLEC